jgi:hypothetical protein
MSKKTLSGIISFMILAAILLSACGGGAPTAQPKSEPTTAGSEAYPATTEGTGNQAYPAGGEPTVDTSGNQAYPAGEATSSEFQILVAKPDGSTATLGSKELSTINIIQVTADSQVVMGYPLPAILTAAGIQDYQQVTFTGASNSLQLTKDKVNDQTVLYTKDGQLNVAGVDIPKDQWVSGITKIEVK